MLTRLRRLSQIVFLAVFIVLLLKTEFRGSFRAAQGDIRLPYPIRWFLEIDPLAAVSNALATRALYRGLLWALVIIVPTLVLGRFFCGWICPLGTLNHFFSNFRSERKLGKARLEKNRYQRWQTLKYYLLIALLVAAVFGAGVVGLLDPISLTVRSLGLAVLPGVNYAVNAAADSLYHTRARGLQLVADGFTFVLKDTLLSFKQPYFRQGFFLGLIFVFILALNFRITRFWCRALCPLGGLLGVLSRWSILGLEKDPSHCDECNRCLLHCQGGDDPLPGAKWRKSECHLCFNCMAECPQKSLVFKFFPRSVWIKQTGGAPWESRWESATATTIDGPDLTRRRVLTGAAAGVALIPLLRSTAGFAVERHERLLRPPGALEESAFLARCIRCGECMKVCPNNALHPTLTEAGLEGLWSPVLAPRIGYCEPSCVLCGQACPTGAIWEISAAEKGWVVGAKNGNPVRLGTAFYDRGRCLPWAMATECIVCEEWCPTSPKAIYLQPAEVKDQAGNVKQVKQPYLNPERCVGCGACEYACPVQDRPAVYVTSVGESRSKTNQILLRRAKRTQG
jgi:polyferredoxin